MEREILKQIKASVNHEKPVDVQTWRPLLARLKSPIQKNKAGKLLSTWKGEGVQGRIAIVGNHTTEGLEYALTYDGIKRGLILNVLQTGYGQWALQMLQPGSELDHFQPDVTFCTLDESVVMQHLSSFDGSVESIAHALKEGLADIKQAVSTFATRTHSTIVLHTIPLPLIELKSIIGFKEKQMVSALWRQFNIQLLELHTSFDNVITLDFEVLAQAAEKMRDERMKHYASMSYSTEVWHCLSPEIVSIVAAQKGLTKKVLALDLDNTLWGGVIGDDGVTGIQLSNEFPGNQFKTLQQLIVKLYKQGVLLTIASKNDWRNVKDVFTKNEHMIITEEMLTQISCHWNPKTDSLRKMAKQLNLGLDSFVFADDHPFERDLMQRELPEVTVIPFEQDPSQYAAELVLDGLFHTFALTEEDRKRSQKYKQLVKHEELKESSTSLDEYLKKLEMILRWSVMKETHVQRVTQLSQRTNQFNLTTERLTEQDVKQTMGESSREVIFTFGLTDRFGDNGLVGYVHIEKSERLWVIRNFVMSCRVFKRQVESEVLRLLVEQAKAEGIHTIAGIYRPTVKNQLVSSFYEEHGFRLEGEKWLYNCDQSLPKISWINAQITTEEVNV
ncbi:HAD family hydrolase [Halalkalibacterium halodurans]|uniref:HAD family hydrolase n=1 Tax=Halalkalibacterium halodurans TaxID=86665 RepID=UPI002AA98977|nr:HAD family hydrolase [Halalkalibacterium halodurans]MDY7222405.1 HAD family hydrolase [Halalkalibacterium halodurans]MDY7241626.1 HAD family hydrolase [Halalkalibacterium halodurans]